MDIFQQVIDQSFKPVLKKEGFVKKGNKWNKKTGGPLIYVAQVEKTTVNRSNFLFRISFGIYINGLHELTYGQTASFYDSVHCIYRAQPKDIGFHKNLWNANDLQTEEEWLAEVNDFLLNYLLPFFAKRNTIEDVLNDFPKDIMEKKTENGLLLTQIAAAYYLEGRGEDAVALLEELIKEYKGQFEFADKVLERIKNKKAGIEPA